MFEFRAGRYGPRIAEILALEGDGHRLMPLAPKRRACKQARATLSRLAASELFAGQQVRSDEFAEAARSGLFLYFSCLEESHVISQGIGSTTGSYWHGIMHRQEPDFANAAYWFRRVRQHQVFPALREAAIGIAGERMPEMRAGSTWDPFRFIDACEEVYRRPEEAREQALREIQRAEWQLLFDFSCRQALGWKE